MFSKARTTAKSPPGRLRPWAVVRSTLLAATVLASSWVGNAVTIKTVGAAVPPAMGPVDPGTNFPTWYQDSNGMRLELCLDGAPNCLAAASDLVAPDGEAFYFNANAGLTTSGGKSLLVLGTEAAFAGAGVGQESVFNRTRIRINTSQPGDFTITWPYGRRTYQVPEVSPLKLEINETVDLGCVATAPDNTCTDGAAPNFDEVLTSLQPFLKWDPAVGPAAPAGFIGDAATPHPVVGSPTGNNVWRIQGPGINPSPTVDGCPTLQPKGYPLADCLETTQFVVQGKLAGPLVSDPARVAFTAQDVGVGASQTVTLRNLGSDLLSVSSASIDPASPGAADFAVTGNTCAAALPRDGTCTVGVSFKPTATGKRAATLSVTHNLLRSPLQIPLAGFGRTAGTAAAVSLSPVSLDFGTVHVGAESAAQRITVTNSGTAPLNISKIVLAGANPGEFRFAADCVSQPIDPGLSCPIDVTFAPVHADTRPASLVLTDDAPNSPQTVALTGTGQPGIVAMGPVDPGTHFPSWYQDSNGLKLTPCLDGLAVCFAGPGDLTPPDGEAFWMGADSSLDLPGGGKAGLVLSTEAAYAGSGSGQEITFNRIRFFATSGLVPGATYKVTHPYGVDSYQAVNNSVAIDGVRRTAGTQDIGCVSAPCDFSLLMQSRVGPFLRFDPAQAPAPPLGYVGDANTPHRVVGSPYNTNIFRVEGPDVNPNPTADACPTLPAAAKADPDYTPANCIETDLFTLQGKILSPGPTVASPSGGSFTAPQQVSLSTQASALTDDAGVKIYYTTDGSEPTLASTPYSGPFTVNTTTTVKAIAVNAAGGVSRLAPQTYTIGAPPVQVTANPKGGVYNTAQSVSLSTTDTTARIYYTTDGSTPTTASSLYAAPIGITTTTTLKFIAVDAAGNQSPVQAEVYTIDTVAPAISANPPAGTYVGTQSVTLGTSKTSTIFYTTNGTAPSTASPRYSGPITVSDSLTLRVLAVDAAGNQATASFAYVIVPPAPTVTAPTQSFQAAADGSVKLALQPSATIQNSTAPVMLKWSGTGATYEIQVSVDGGAFGTTLSNGATLPQPVGAATSLQADLPLGVMLAGAPPRLQIHTYQFRVRACDSAATNCSTYALGSKFILAPVDDSLTGPLLNGGGQVAYSGSWQTGAVTGAYNGSVHFATAPGARAALNKVTYTISGNAAWVTTLGPDRGRATVQVDNGPVQTIDLYAPTAQPARVVWQTGDLSSNVQHTVTVTVTGTKNAASTSPRVDIDAFLIIH